MRIALLFQDRNFVGREYFAHLTDAGLRPDVVAAVGQMSDDSIAIERARTGDRWNPPAIPEKALDARFSGLSDPALWSLLRTRGVDLAIQGGLGILKPDMLAVPRLGFVNVHPGKLPEYRGRNCPEWAILNGDDVWVTAHLIDAGIDTGPTVAARLYELAPDWDYADFRANLYAHCARVLIDALRRLDGATPETLGDFVSVQDEARAHYWPAMEDADLARTKEALAKRTGGPRP